MKYLSVCSGIEAATVAWHPLGWSPIAFAEIEKFPSAVLAHHYPHVPNLGDIARFKDWPDAAIDVLVGGTPCQSFSVAGLRKGLEDPRGNLALTYCAILNRYRPRWFVWENVPGVLSSDGGRAFGSILGAVAELGYGFAYRVLDAQYVRVDGFTRAVPQRRRRVFVVGYLGDWRRPAAVLFERESLRWNSPPRRQAGEGIAPTISSRTSGGGGLGTDFDCDGGLVAGTLNANGKAAGSATQQDAESGLLVARSLRAQANHSHRADSDNVIAVAHALRADGFDASEDGTGRGTPIIPVVADTLTANWIRGNGAKAGNQVGSINPIITFDTTQITSKTNRCNPQPGDPCHPLAAGAHAPAVAFDAAETWRVRRLIPRECERLQGFEDDYTRVPGAAAGGWRDVEEDESLEELRAIGLQLRQKGNVWRVKDPDGPRYKALGNSMAVNVMRWIGGRIALVEAMTSSTLTSQHLGTENG